MKNFTIPPIISTLIGVALIIVIRLPLFNHESTVVLAIQALGFFIAVIGFAGLIGKLLKKKQ
ncbi:MAG: hypothetical protein Q8Q25_00825 [bacterium]|nr:hypothetical protein [bacterium]